MTLPCSSNEFNFFLIVSFTFFADYNFTCTEENSQKNYSTYFTSSSCHGNLQSGILWGWGGGGGGRVTGKRKKRNPLASERRGEGLPPDRRLLAWIT